ncbi:Uncharacterised protein [Yersinia intermedia]|nr:Uncharacterised protein [Yersinia intermedia]CNH42449.1 Uncharacterised protein [Yersinia intermedia]
MHTQNVNVNSATEASWICERTTPRFDGFVCNIHSRHPFDVNRADVVIQRLEKEANKGGQLLRNLRITLTGYGDELDGKITANRSPCVYGGGNEAGDHADTGRRTTRTGLK